MVFETNSLSIIPNEEKLGKYIYIYVCVCVCVLYIDLRPGQTCHSKDGGSAYSIGVGELG